MAKGYKTGGREQGTPNKITKDVKEAFQMLVESNLDNLNTWLLQIATKDPAKAMSLIIDIAEFILPKLAKSESIHDFKQNVIIVDSADKL